LASAMWFFLCQCNAALRRAKRYAPENRIWQRFLAGARRVASILPRLTATKKAALRAWPPTLPERPPACVLPHSCELEMIRTRMKWCHAAMTGGACQQRGGITARTGQRRYTASRGGRSRQASTIQRKTGQPMKPRAAAVAPVQALRERRGSLAWAGLIIGGRRAISATPRRPGVQFGGRALHRLRRVHTLIRVDAAQSGQLGAAL
jgi:hypothetical protein